MDRALLAEKAAVVERHLERVRSCLPASPEGFHPATDASDAVILHLWQAVQIVIDVAVSICVARGLGTPSTYADAFRRLTEAGELPAELADRLSRAVGFRNVVAHAYERVDMQRVHEAARTGPADLRAFLGIAADLPDAR